MKKISNYRIKILLVIAIAITLITGLSTTYAFFIYRVNGSNVSLETGDVKITFSNGNNNLNVEDFYPISDEIGMILPYYSDFTVNSTTNDVDIKYEIQLVPNSGNTIDTQYIKVYLTDQNDNKLSNVKYYNDLSEASYNKDAKTVYTNYMTKSMTKNFRLRVWIDENYVNNAAQDFGFTIYLYAINDDVTLLLDEMESKLSLTSSDVDGTRFVYGETVDDNYVWYSGKLWRIVAINGDETIKLVTQGNMTTLEWDTSSTNTDYSTSQIRRWLNNEFLPTLYDVDDLLVDYEWDYTAYVDFPTKKITENTTKLTGENAEKVGLINIYEFMMTGGTDSTSTSKTFLNNGYSSWTMSPKTIGTDVWIISYLGNVNSNHPLNNHSVRPSITLKAGITILGGDGTKSNPYTIDGDKTTGASSELLSNRISGEYINFNNTKYRIVGVETINGKKLTKVTMADFDKNSNTLATSVAFGSTTAYSISEGVGKYLLDWYNATSETDTEGTYAGLYISKTYKDMMATSDNEGVYWWIGPERTSSGDYTLAKTGTTISTSIGLGYYGEVFSSQFGDGYNSSAYTWLMTRRSGTNVWYLSIYGHIDAKVPTTTYGVRPSFYLKADVKIGDTDGDGKIGTGKPNDPYEIVQ